VTIYYRIKNSNIFDSDEGQNSSRENDFVYTREKTRVIELRILLPRVLLSKSTGSPLTILFIKLYKLRGVCHNESFIYFIINEKTTIISPNRSISVPHPLVVRIDQFDLLQLSFRVLCVAIARSLGRGFDGTRRVRCSVAAVEEPLSTCCCCYL
jgi:hypothetical protein